MASRGRVTLAMFVAGGLLVVLGLALFVSPLASSSPDGLERVAADQGFADAAGDHDLGDSPLAGYDVAGVDDEGLGTGIAGVVGVAITFGLALILFGLLRRTHDRRERAAPA